MSNQKTFLELCKSRNTTKIFSTEVIPNSLTTDWELEIDYLLQAASTAPFHFPCNTAHRTTDRNSIAPWRYYWADKDMINKSIRMSKTLDIKLAKFEEVLNSSAGMMIVTWLPEPKTENSAGLFEPNLLNMEHIAGASASVQNFILAATQRNIPNFWSSGNAFRDGRFYNLFGIENNQIILGVVLLFDPETTMDKNLTISGGGHHGKAYEYNGWFCNI